jgi:CHAT domain-containing protein
LSRVALVELFVQPDDTLAFLLRADREAPRLERLALGRDAALEWTREVLAGIVQDGDRGARLKERQAPLQALLDAIEQDTDAGDVVCVVPHGPLHLVPFHALELSAGPLIHRNPVVYAPSASVLASVTGRPRERAPRGAVVAGDTRGDLPFADAEAGMVAQMLAVEPIPGREATRRRLIDAIAAATDLRILHLACHGSFDLEDPLASGILTAVADDADEAASVLSARDLLDIGWSADLVALSACDSGLSERRPGDELVGLTRALLVAGARTVLASLWKVDDHSTGVLMRAFYEGWVRDRLSKAEALRRAQCHVMGLTAAELHAAAGGRPAVAGQRDFGGAAAASPAPETPAPEARVFAHPRHWAAFTLVGDWR